MWKWVYVHSKISHGLFDYLKKDYNLSSLKIEPKSQVLMRVGSQVQAFDSFERAREVKETEAWRGKHKSGEEYWTFLFWTLLSENNINIYSYNQLEVILNYFDDSKVLREVNFQLANVFNNCKFVRDAKDLLKFFDAEGFSKDLWKVAKTLNWLKNNKAFRIETKGVELEEGNIIKMGRLKMRLKTIKLPANFDQDNQKAKENSTLLAKENEEDPVDVKDISYVISDQTDEISPWRFWLSNVMENQNNPLINPWFCKGTQGLLHLECLKSWMGAKKSHKVFSQFSEMYSWKTMSWELCQAPYPFKISFGGKQVSLLEYDEPDEPFLAFETFLKEGWNKATSKSIYILRLKHIGNYKVGRSHDVEFHWEDISVSRFHSEIQITPEKVFMQDYKSKFGTQILIKGTEALDKNDWTKNMFQVGRTWIMATYESKKKKSIFSCWFKKGRDVTSSENEDVLETDRNLLDDNLFTKLEHDIENLQKDRDSVFYLDDSFYNKLMDIYINHGNETGERKATEVYENRETIDDVRIAESKENESDSSDGSHDNNSEESDEDEESDESESIINSDSNSIRESSLEGIGDSNHNSSIIAKVNALRVSKPV